MSNVNHIWSAAAREIIGASEVVVIPNVDQTVYRRRSTDGKCDTTGIQLNQSNRGMYYYAQADGPGRIVEANEQGQPLIVEHDLQLAFSQTLGHAEFHGRRTNNAQSRLVIGNLGSVIVSHVEQNL